MRRALFIFSVTNKIPALSRMSPVQETILFFFFTERVQYLNILKRGKTKPLPYLQCVTYSSRQIGRDDNL